jgi:hypothetical protein
MPKVKARVQELIPTAKFANVEIDLELHGEHTDFIEPSDDPEKDYADALEKAYDIADAILQKKRDPIIEELEKGNL